MNIEALRVFVVVAEHGSLKAAAAELGMALATLTRRIEELEVEAGVPLLVGLSHGIRATRPTVGPSPMSRLPAERCGVRGERTDADHLRRASLQIADRYVATE